ncbi:hypothetical protein Nepgr_006394 [Nepenthes gracilis]|uniref:CCR4-NOT transcription complex subunit 10 n=1 Tax=Nepenthes gracilis TaxID=150966 RepID=A0AAD3S585_NEPGR|nr:hypothetical protein Nepgr_006394 [Nepenthes gracilis]
MDSRDLSSSSSMNVTREGGSSADYDGVLSVAVSLAKEAAALFQSRKYAECVDVLNQLLQKKEYDPKVLHNIALAEFFRDGCSDPKKLLEALLGVKTKCEDLAHASGEEIDATSQPGNRAVSVPKVTNSVSPQNSLSNCASVVYTEEFDPSLAVLNMAIILFYLHQYPKALSVLEPLFQNIEPIDERTALHVCLLLLDITLATRNVSKFADVINYLEKAFGVTYMMNQADNGSTGQQQPSDPVCKSSSVPGNASAQDDLNSDIAITGNTSEDSLSRTLSDVTIEYETLLSTLDIGGQNLSRASNLSSSSDLPRSPADLSSVAVDLKLTLPLYKVQLLLLIRSLKAAKREVKLAVNIAPGRDSSKALLLKSQLEYARGNYPKALKLLAASNNQTEVGSSIIFNNYGCIYYQQVKYHTASIFFRKALRNCLALQKEKPRTFASFSQDKSLLITYNCGVQYLACGRPILAARCFQKASSVFHNRPLLWLRLAECCLMALEKGLLKSSATLSHGSEFKVHVVGHGKWRHLALDNGFSMNGYVNSERTDPHQATDSEPKLSMSFARQCLLNALHLLSYLEPKQAKSGLLSKSVLEESELSNPTLSSSSNQNTNSGNDSKTTSKDMTSSGPGNSNGDIKEQRGGTSVITAAVISSSEYEEICRRENEMIKKAVLVDLVFVELELGNPHKALLTALLLLELPECSKMHAFLGHVYAAEALCLLNKPKEAADHLLTYLSSGNNVEIPYTKEDCDQWQIKKTIDPEETIPGSVTARKPSSEESHDAVFLKPEDARGALYVNLAAVFAMQGDLEQADHHAKQALLTTPNSREVILMAVYLDLKRGNSEEALAKLKQCSRLSFLSSDLKLKSPH